MQRIECLYEQDLKESGYVQIFDGQTTSHKATEQLKSQPEERRFFIRRYQKVRNNRFVNKWVTLKYDFRIGYFVECTISTKLSDGSKQEQTMLSKDDNPSSLKFITNSLQK